MLSQLEQARLLEAQVQANKARLLKEKKDRDDEELRQEEKLAKERQEMQLMYEKEVQMAKVGDCD